MDNSLLSSKPQMHKRQSLPSEYKIFLDPQERKDTSCIKSQSTQTSHLTSFLLSYHHHLSMSTTRCLTLSSPPPPKRAKKASPSPPAPPPPPVSSPPTSGPGDGKEPSVFDVLNIFHSHWFLNRDHLIVNVLSAQKTEDG